MQDKDGDGEYEISSECLRDMLRPGEGLCVSSLQAQYSLYKMQQEPEGVPYLQGQD